MAANKAILLSLLLLLQLTALSNSITLSTSGRWIVDPWGNRVKLTCTNWVSHSDPMLPEGLDKKPVGYIARRIALTGFNCVRFTWSTFMFTRESYGNMTVSESLDRLKLEDAKAGFERNNPMLLPMKLADVHRAVVDELGRNRVMVVLDNHVSHPQWCCKEDDGNGFFGDYNFDPSEWLEGLTIVANRYKDHPAVIGMSLRNELRGPRQNAPDWYKYMGQGASTVHQLSPHFLVILSGLSFDTDLTFLHDKPLPLGNLDNKLVYEGHWYSFGYKTPQWVAQTNSLCAQATHSATYNFLFLTNASNPFPVFLSEFGIDQRGINEGDNRYMSCLLAAVAEFDVDWALWTFQGSYMFRENKTNSEETYGLMDGSWTYLRNASFLPRLEIIRQMNQGPGATGPIYYRMFHPQSGQCVVVGALGLFLGDCRVAGLWEGHEDGGAIRLARSPLCLSSVGDGSPARVLVDCNSSGSQWKYGSSSRLHLAVQDGQGENLCLERSGSSTLVTSKCLCLGKDLEDFSTCSDNPEVQWFKLVPLHVGRI